MTLLTADAGSGLEVRTIDARPQAAMLIESMRDIGYSLETAVADIIDNSITARATEIRIFVDVNEGTVTLGILDNGAGMAEADLIDAMRPGNRNPLETRTLSDLGRFGLGLKTASFSQCRCLTVVSRHEETTSAAVWDLDFVARSNEWLVQVPADLADIPWVDRLGESGTLVIWQNLDRLIEKAGSAEAHSIVARRINDTREHVELVFHRFLSGEPGLKKVRIFLNERSLEPFDPFHSSHPATTHGPVERIKVGSHVVKVQPFTLPHHRRVTPAEWERFGGGTGYVKNQGFYVYREKRLIVHGTWFGLARQKELTKLARVRIDIGNGLDAEWKIDVKKSSAQPPYQVRERLRRLVESLGANSKRAYTVRGRRLAGDRRLPFWNRLLDKGEIAYRINPDHPVIGVFAGALPQELRADFSRILELAAATLPLDALFADLGSAPEHVSGPKMSDETLSYATRTTVFRLRAAGVSQDDIADMLRSAEPFRSNWQATAVLLETMLREETACD